MYYNMLKRLAITERLDYMKKIIINLLLSLLILSGCSFYRLNERQKTILAKEGLSTKYNKLNSSQQKMIKSVEKMLTFIENKYNVSFEYVSYCSKENGDCETLEVYPEKNKVEGFPVNIKMIEGNYCDDYVKIYSKWPLETYLRENIKKNYVDKKIKIFADIRDISLSEIPKAGVELDGNVSAGITLFVDSSTCSKANFIELKEFVEKFLVDHRIESELRIFYEKAGYIDDINDFNYLDYLEDEYIYSVE